MSARYTRPSLLSWFLVVAIALLLLLPFPTQAAVQALVGARERVPDPPDPNALLDACSVSGFISSDTTWSLATCDPYVVSGSIIVQTGATLTIQPGTRVKFDNQKALTVQGTLVARGTAESPITFTSNQLNPAKGDWGYIHFADTSVDATFDGDGNYTGGSVLQYVIVEYAGGASVSENGTVRVEASSPYLDHNTIRNNKVDGIHVWSNGAPRITNNTIRDNGISGSTNAYGIYLNTNAGLLVSDNIVFGNTSQGINCTCGGGTVTISNNTVTENGGRGIYVDIYTNQVTLSNNAVMRNRDGGIHCYECEGTVNILGNTVISNTTTNLWGGGISARLSCKSVVTYSEFCTKSV